MKSSRIIYLFWRYVRLFRKGKPDFVITSSFTILFNLFLAKILSAQNFKIIFKIETNFKEYLSNKGFMFDRLLYKFFSHIVFKNINLIVCSSRSLADSVKEEFNNKLNEKIIYIYNPVITNKDREKRGTVTHKFFDSHSPETIKLISVGRLIPSKGYQGLISIVEKLKRGAINKDFKLLIVGEGSEKNNLWALIKEKKLELNVDIIGFNDHFIDYIFKSDIYISNSEFEGLNNNIIHALKQGKHVISTDCEFGPKEILKNGKYGSLVPLGSEQAMIDKILEIANLPLSERMQIDHLKERAEEFSAEKNSEKLLNAIKLI
jgi:glycosyltransferase involved in cell wall biosynthesis